MTNIRYIRHLQLTFVALVIGLSILFVASQSSYAAEEVDSGTCGDNATWTVTDDHTLTIEGMGETDGYSGESVVINDSNSITQPWNNYRSFINTVVVKEGITSLGNGFFAYNYNISNVSLPSSLKTIGNHVFLNCQNLQTISLPQEITAIGGGAFCYCENLTSIELPKSLNELGSGAFMDCSKLQCVDIPEKVTVIKDGLFYNDNGLRRVTMGNNVTKIEDNAFLCCNRISGLVIPESVEEIGKDAFIHCYKIWDIVMPAKFYEKDSIDKSFKDSPLYLKSQGGVSGANGSTIFRIDENGIATVSGDGMLCEGFLYTGGNVDSYRYMVKKVIVKGNISEIDSYAFRYFINMTEVDILSKARIDTNAFCNCEELSIINIGEDITEIESNPVYGCGNLRTIVFDGTMSKWKTYGLSSSDINNAEVICTKKDNTEISLSNKTVCFTGDAVSIDEAIVTGSTSEIKYKYYADEQCTNQLTSLPSEMGTYYVKAFVESDAYWNAAESNIAKLIIQDHVWKHETNKATLAKNGSEYDQCSACSKKKDTMTIYCPKMFKLSATAYTYNGKGKKPTVTIKNLNGETISSANYTVAYSKNKYVGKATAKITFKGTKYSGTKLLTFKINPKGTSLIKLTAKKKAFTATWKKQATQTTGYQIQYSQSNKFASGNKLVTVAKKGTTSKTISKLKAKKTYYIRVRTYKTVKGVKYYSAWSAKKYVKIK